MKRETGTRMAFFFFRATCATVGFDYITFGKPYHTICPRTPVIISRPKEHRITLPHKQGNEKLRQLCLSSWALLSFNYTISNDARYIQSTISSKTN